MSNLTLDVIEDCIPHCVPTIYQWSGYWLGNPSCLIQTRLLYLPKGTWVGCFGVHCLLECFWIHNPVDMTSQGFQISVPKQWRQFTRKMFPCIVWFCPQTVAVANARMVHKHIDIDGHRASTSVLRLAAINVSGIVSLLSVPASCCIAAIKLSVCPWYPSSLALWD